MEYLEEQNFSSKDEFEQVIYDFNNTRKIYDTTITIHELFEKQVGKSPDKIAAVCLDQRITYRELNQKANHIAKRLRSSGVKRNDIVGLIVYRSLDMLIGIMSILKAGGCYLPIDPSYPESRINYMLEDSKTSTVLTHEQLRESIDFDGQVITFDEENLYTADSLNIENINASSDLAYVIYTSGSTGKPKGVMLEHRAVHNFILGVIDQINFLSDKSIVCLTTISFDIFVLESILPLLLGMKIIIADPMQLAKYLAKETVDMLQTTPSTMQLILNDESNHQYISRLREIMLGGEAFPKRLLQELRKHTTAKIYNMYGPTETTVWSAIKDLSYSDKITIGKPIANTQIYIVDDKNNPLGIDIVGELCIAGDGLARGYLNRASLTHERFVENPIAKSKKMYKTGDMAKWLYDGEIEFLGRKDNQVKIRGFRIELGEIEDCLSKLGGIKECAVAAKENEVGENYLVAYYIADKELLVSDIIAFLRKSLPEFMIPGFYMRIEKLPLTLNFKIDRKALPQPDKNRPLLDTKYLAPETQIEIQITDIWRKALNRELIGIHDNFFELGGNSILVSQMHVELEKFYPGRVKVVDIFSYPSVSALSHFIGQKDTEVDPKDPIQALKFPGDFVSNGSRHAAELAFSITVDSSVCDKLELLSKVNSVSVKSILLSSYMNLLSEITGKEEIHIFSATGDLQPYKCLCLNFAKTADLIELCKITDKQIDDVSQGTQYTEYNFDKIMLEEGSYIPTFYFDQITDGHKENEIALEINRHNSGLLLNVYNNSGNLQKSSFENLMASYVGLLKAISENS